MLKVWLHEKKNGTPLEQVSVWFILDAYNDSNKYVNW